MARFCGLTYVARVNFAYATRFRKWRGWKMAAGMYAAASISPHQPRAGSVERNHLRAIDIQNSRVRPRDKRAGAAAICKLPVRGNWVSRSQVVFSVGIHRGGSAQLLSEVSVTATDAEQSIHGGVARDRADLQSAVCIRDGEGAGQQRGGEGHSGCDGEHHGGATGGGFSVWLSCLLRWWCASHRTLKTCQMPHNCRVPSTAQMLELSDRDDPQPQIVKFVPIQKIKREFRRETRDVLHSRITFHSQEVKAMQVIDPEDHERAKLCGAGLQICAQIWTGKSSIASSAKICKIGCFRSLLSDRDRSSTRAEGLASCSACQCQRPIWQNQKTNSKMSVQSSKTRYVAKLLLLLVLESTRDR